MQFISEIFYFICANIRDRKMIRRGLNALRPLKKAKVV
ncbi:hypothetical protein LEP1GSC194_1941 [Leptospira alstonii serovar Sichuan str. 79601]|uniref:Uncharacterized protein n=1 Tax=Leptospira alstonii serovar Sichuan str. 79601 TaxID=1218565 RepID=M6D0Q8_9LEPT|nr:hypothetical protein LEP1GSC194_1941 [Leptospira alstonii serovar Sichuan str. 79601]